MHDISIRHNIVLKQMHLLFHKPFLNDEILKVPSTLCLALRFLQEISIYQNQMTESKTKPRITYFDAISISIKVYILHNRKEENASHEVHEGMESKSNSLTNQSQQQ